MIPLENAHRIRVRIAEFKVVKGDAVLVAIGLGSCVGVALYDIEQQVGGMAHILLPGKGDKNDNPYKFAETSIKAMVNEIVSMGGKIDSLNAKLVGGANMFAWMGDAKKTVGERNVNAARETLKELNIPIVSEDVGGHDGRSVEFHPGTGKIILRNALGEERVI